ncbi:serine hydrolase [Actinoallomurus purpureus]|nr:serine hydrolase [Actinoallomurus purpureus]MCO6005492.1 serine hydrolase [Actinoallomurus purpureus]
MFRQVFARGYGVAGVATRRHVDTEHTGFLMGSMAKLFTATAALPF